MLLLFVAMLFLFLVVDNVHALMVDVCSCWLLQLQLAVAVVAVVGGVVVAVVAVGCCSCQQKNAFGRNDMLARQKTAAISDLATSNGADSRCIHVYSNQ